MSLYDGLGVETAPIPAEVNDSSTSAKPASLSGWSSGLKLMASQLQRNKKALKATQQKARSQPTTTVLEPSSAQLSLTVKQAPAEQPVELLEDDLAMEIEDEYDPMVPNNYEMIVKERREQQEKAREEQRKHRREERERERRGRQHRHSSSSDSEEEEKSKKSRRKDSAAIPPPTFLSNETEKKPEEKEKTVVESALEELSRTKAQKANPFAKPKIGSVASQIMSKYGWKEGQGLGRQSQGISTALAVEKTSKRGGKIVNIAAETEQQLEQEKKKAQSLAEVMRNPTKVVLLQNMVGPGEVDEDLQPEVIEECSKYGEVSNCLVFEIPHGAPDDEAVRIFVEFQRLESAIKSVVDLNGRFFGGRTVKASFFPEERFSRYDLAPLQE